MNEHSFPMLPKDVVVYMSQFMDVQSTTTCMLTSGTVHRLFSIRAMDQWRIRLQAKYGIASHITQALLCPHLVYQRLENLANSKTTCDLLHKIRYSYCSDYHDPYAAPWLLFPYTPEYQNGFIALLNDGGKAVQEDLLEKAAKVGNLALVQYLITVCRLKPDEHTLRCAASSGNLELVKYLVKNQQLIPNEDTLRCGIRSANLKLVTYLVQIPALKASTVDIASPLLENAAETGNVELFEYLCIEYNLKPDDSTLFRALRSGNSALIGALISQYNCEVYHWVFGHQNINLMLIKFLNKHFGFKPDDLTMNEALMSGNLKLVKYLVNEHGLIPEDCDCSAFLVAGNIKLVDYLINERKLVPTAQWLYHSLHSGNLALVEYLITNHKLKFSEDKLGTIATTHGNLILVQYLIEELGFVPNYEWLLGASVSGNLSLVKYLVEVFKLSPFPHEQPSLSLREAVRNGLNLAVAKYFITDCKHIIDLQPYLKPLEISQELVEFYEEWRRSQPLQLEAKSPSKKGCVLL